MRRSRGEGVGEPFPARHAAATILAFCVAGIVPLLPHVAIPGPHRSGTAALATLLTLFTVGALRATVVRTRWWIAGMEMLLVGAVAAGVSYGVGRLLAGPT